MRAERAASGTCCSSRRRRPVARRYRQRLTAHDVAQACPEFVIRSSSAGLFDIDIASACHGPRRVRNELCLLLTKTSAIAGASSRGKATYLTGSNTGCSPSSRKQQQNHIQMTSCASQRCASSPPRLAQLKALETCRASATCWTSALRQTDRAMQDAGSDQLPTA